MPELVEVETTKRDLSKIIEGKKIRKACVYLDKIVYNKRDEFIEKVTGKTVEKVKRRGKWLLFELVDSYIIIHFRMEGRFYLKKLNDKINKHDYVIFDFDDFSLHYNDPRLFGKMEVYDGKDINKFFEEKKLGLEYDDSNLTSKYLKNKFKNHHVEVKKMLLDQSIVTGIGNIYADEILFESRINPKSYADKLSLNELEKIIKNIKKVFEKALIYKGTYPNIDGNRGTFEEVLNVHMRKNEPCYVCGSLIIKEKVGERGTYYCPTCQKIKK